LLVIDRGISSDQGIKFVYVIDDKKQVQSRRVTTGALQDDGLRVIASGLKPDDWVVVGGLQQVRPHATVQTEKVEMPSLPVPQPPSGNVGAGGPTNNDAAITPAANQSQPAAGTAVSEQTPPPQASQEPAAPAPAAVQPTVPQPVEPAAQPPAQPKQKSKVR